MATMYEYSNLSDVPCQAYIREYLEDSDMTNKNMTDISFHPVEMWLKVWFDPALDTSDKIIFDGIVNDSLGKTKVTKSREEIIREIFESVGSQEQLGRLMDAFDDYPSFTLALDNLNYALAMTRAQKALDDGAVLQEDYDLVATKVPDSPYV